MNGGELPGLQEAAKFGERIIAWFENLIGFRLAKRALRMEEDEAFLRSLVDRSQAVTEWLVANPQPTGKTVSLYVRAILFGAQPNDEDQPPAITTLLSDPQQFFFDLLSYGFNQPEARKQWESLGALIYDTSVTSITGRPPPRESEAANRARAFVGFVTALGAIPQITASGAEAATGGQVDELGQNIQNIYWNLGLGFLTWQTMAPLLQAAILEPLERDTQRLWRGKRFTRNEQQDLFALGKITREQLTEALRDEGWRDEDIDYVIELAYRQLSRGDIIDLWHRGIWTAEQAADRLRGQGYDPEAVELIMRLEDKDDVTNDRKESISVLGNSFEDGLLPEAEFRQALDAQGYTEREVDLRVQLIRLKQQDKARKLTVAQLKNAWQENVVGDQEVIFRLTEEGYADSEVGLILDTWKAELQPDFIRVNQSTILEMYRYAILDRRAAKEQLTSIGYHEDDAEALIALTEARFPTEFGGAPARKQRLLSVGAVTDLVAMGRIDEDGIRQWAQQSGFSPVDVENMVTLIIQQAKEIRRPLSQSTIEDAYITGVFSREEAVRTLQQIGFALEDAETILQTVEAQNPVVFAPGTVTSVRQPTIGALVQAVQSGFITEIEFYEKAALIGFNKEGARIYLENARAKLVKGTKQPSKTDVLEFYRKNLIGYPEARSKLEDLGYSSSDADLLLRAEQKGVQSNDIWNAMIAGLLDAQDALIALLALGYTEDEINAAFESLG